MCNIKVSESHEVYISTKFCLSLSIQNQCYFNNLKLFAAMCVCNQLNFILYIHLIFGHQANFILKKS